MNPLTAVCFLLCSLAICAWTCGDRGQAVARVAASATCALSIWILSAWLGHWQVRPDQWLFASKLELEQVPNRMAPNTALAFCLVSFAILTLGAKRAQVAQTLAFGAGMLGATTLLGYILSLGQMQAFGTALPMALSTSTAFVLLAAALFTVRPGEGYIYPFSGSAPAAIFARRLLAASFLVPVLVTAIRLQGQRMGLYSVELGSAMGAVASILAFSLLVWRAATVLRRTDDQLTELYAGIQSRAAELELARETADRANRAKSEFLSRMSHELRTPMNAVIGYAQLIEMSSNDPKALESAVAILKGGRHLLALINEVLDLARIEAGKLAISLEPVPIAGALTQAIELVRPSAEAKNVQIQLQEPPEELYALADRQRLVQVLVNLVSNAVKFNRAGGVVILRCQLGVEDRLWVEIEDDGPGISMEAIPQLFVPFERSCESVEGTGLGLALSSSLMGLMGGAVALQTTGPQGSVFRLELAVAANAQAAEQPLESDHRHTLKWNGPPLRIAYIEDNQPNIFLIRRVFEEAGSIELHTAMRADEGLRLVGEVLPDVVLLDMHLPDAHGSEVLRQLRQESATREIPVVVISADATEHQIRRLLALGAHAYLTKPIDLPALLGLLESIGPRERSAA